MVNGPTIYQAVCREAGGSEALAARSGLAQGVAQTSNHGTQVGCLLTAAVTGVADFASADLLLTARCRTVVHTSLPPPPAASSPSPHLS